jgi:8-oxo-dGTP pyrophosphatase MutT (NUDIX family)
MVEQCVKNRKQESKEEVYKYGISVGGIVTYNNKLLLVGDKEGNYGIPAGHAEPFQRPMDVIRKELIEETGLSTDFMNNLPYNEPSTYWIATDTKTSVGFVIGGLHIPDGTITLSKWKVDDPDGDIVMAKLFDADEVFSLITSSRGIRKPEFNVGQLAKWLLSVVNLQTNSEVRKWVLENQYNYKYGVFQETRDTLNYHHLVFRPLNFIGDKGIMLHPDLEELLDLEKKVMTESIKFR